MDSILDKVRKLFALAADRAGTPEGETYENKAMELLAKHGLDEAMARSFSKDGLTADDKLTVREVTFSDPYGYERANLWNSIATALHCSFAAPTAFNTGSCSYKTIGLRRHLDRAQILTDLLMVQMIGGASKLINDQPFQRERLVELRKEYMMGFIKSVGLRLRLAESRAAGEYDSAHGGNGAELMMISDSARANAAFEKMFPGAQGRRARPMSGPGFSAGVAAGAAADIGQTRVSRARQAIS